MEKKEEKKTVTTVTTIIAHRRRPREWKPNESPKLRDGACNSNRARAPPPAKNTARLSVFTSKSGGRSITQTLNHATVVGGGGAESIRRVPTLHTSNRTLTDHTVHDLVSFSGQIKS